MLKAEYRTESIKKKGGGIYVTCISGNMNWRTAKKQLTFVGSGAGELGD